jgi:hypothetical protein
MSVFDANDRSPIATSAATLGVGTGSPGTFLQAAVLNDGLGAWRNAMLHLFLTPSPLLGTGEVLVGISLPMFVAALIAAYGHRIRLSVGR